MKYIQKIYSREDILNALPQRPPFILIDEILSIDIKEKTAICKKYIAKNDVFLQGHFPSNPILPGALLIELMAQTSIIIAKKIVPNIEIAYLTHIEKASFRKIIKPESTLIIHSKITKYKMGLFKFDCNINIETKQEIVAESQIAAFAQLAKK